MTTKPEDRNITNPEAKRRGYNPHTGTYSWDGGE